MQPEWSLAKINRRKYWIANDALSKTSSGKAHKTEQSL
jgi:hypothetical protein